MKTVYTKLAIASAMLAIGTAAGVANADDSGRWYLGAGIGFNSPLHRALVVVNEETRWHETG